MKESVALVIHFPDSCQCEARQPPSNFAAVCIRATRDGNAKEQPGDMALPWKRVDAIWDFGLFWYPFNIDVSHVQKRAVSVAFA